MSQVPQSSALSRLFSTEDRAASAVRPAEMASPTSRRWLSSSSSR